MSATARTVLKAAKPLYLAALDGTLASPTTATCLVNPPLSITPTPMVSVTFSNYMEIPVTVSYAAPPGQAMPSGQATQGGELIPFFIGIPPRTTSAGMPMPAINGHQAVFRQGQCFVLTSTSTGGLIGVIQINGSGEIPINCELTLPPNVVGPFPAPNTSFPIPSDSPRVMVACGAVTDKNGNPNGYLVREQYWERQHDSYTLAPFEKRTISLTTTSGKQATSSHQTQIAASLGLSASGGWGPVSASISASLSVDASYFQQVTVTEQATTYVSAEIHNRTATPATYFRWQLTDVVTIFSNFDKASVLAINCGAGAIAGSPFAPDSGYSGGTSDSTSNPINTSLIPPTVPPVAVYQSNRWIAGTMTYTLAGLAAGDLYTVTLHFADFTFSQSSQRQFNVSINNSQVLTNFDVIGEAGGPNKAISRAFTAKANSSGKIVLTFSQGAQNNPIINGIVIQNSIPAASLIMTEPPVLVDGPYNPNALPATPSLYPTAVPNLPPSQSILMLSCGNSNPPQGWSSDSTYVSSGASYAPKPTPSVSLTLVPPTAPPQAVYQSSRYFAGTMTYTITNSQLTAGKLYTVTLHFAEIDNQITATGQRQFNVSINGRQVLTNFDIFQEAGGQNVAIARIFTTKANSSGQIVIVFSQGPQNNPTINGIVIQAANS
jgi:hypothetical protein